jgi:hypothetical protein
MGLPEKNLVYYRGETEQKKTGSGNPFIVFFRSIWHTADEFNHGQW